MRAALKILCVAVAGLLGVIAPQRAGAQSREYQYIHQGNKSYEAKDYTAAEESYKRALSVNPNSSRAYYNLGNTQLAQKHPKEAMEAYEKGVGMEKNKLVKAMFYHNMGVILQSQQQFASAIDCYKNALRNNPADEEARYNLLLCQHQLKKNPQQQRPDAGKNDKQDGEDKQKKEEQKQNESKPTQSQQNQMSRDNAEQLLNLTKQAEQRTRDKVKNVQPAGKQFEKNW